jgi:hypothetical protein
LVTPRGNSAERRLTTEEALAIGEQAKPTHRLDKLQRGVTTDLSALNKSNAAMSDSLSGMTAQLSKIAADVEVLQNFTPDAPIRRMHS